MLEPATVEESASVEQATVEESTSVEQAAVEPVEEEAIEDISSLQEALSGEVEIGVAPFPDVERLAALYNHLQTMNGLRVLHSTGSWDKGTVVTVVLDRPLEVGDLVPSALGAKVSLNRGKPGAEDGGGQHSRITLDFPDA